MEPSIYLFCPCSSSFEIEGRTSSGKAASGHGGGGAGSSGSGSGSGGKSSAPIDYSRYVKRFGSASECGSPYCKDLNYRFVYIYKIPCGISLLYSFLMNIIFILKNKTKKFGCKMAAISLMVADPERVIERRAVESLQGVSPFLEK
jgi:hypothetical protein